MSTVVIGGHTRSVGKTSVVAGLIAALRDRCWTALKITQYGHGICSANGKPCDCGTGDHSWAVTEERDRSGKSDTSRFLVAGAEHSWWVRTEQGRLAEAMPRVRAILAGAENAIIESNSILRFLKPYLYLTVLDPATEDFKSSAQQFLDRADAVLLHARIGFWLSASGVGKSGFRLPASGFGKTGSRLPASGSQFPASGFGERNAHDEDVEGSESNPLMRPIFPEAGSREPGTEGRFGPAWKQVSLKPVSNRPIFAICPPDYVTPEIVAFVRSRLSGR